MASRRGATAYLINNEAEIDANWLKGVKTIGLTAGASTPEEIVQKCIQRLIDFGVEDVEDVVYITEDVVFQLPKPIVNAFLETKRD
jgi:4-hydroxy-3-methylbut-2-enyl diphosphate reductase